MSAPCQISNGTQIEDFSDKAEWSEVDAAYTWAAVEKWWKGAEKTAFRPESRSDHAAGYYQKTVSLNLSSLYTPAMRLEYYAPPYYPIASPSVPAYLIVQFSSATDFSKYFSYTSTLLPMGHNYLIIGDDEWTNTGGESWSNTMVRMRIGIDPTTMGHLPEVECIELRGGVQTTPSVCIQFDNWQYGVMTNAFPFLDGLGHTASAQVDITDIESVGHPDKPETSDFLILQDAGWTLIERFMPESIYPDIPHLLGFDSSNEEIKRETIEWTRRWWDTHGLSSSGIFTCIGARMNDEIWRTAREYGYRYSVVNGYYISAPLTAQSRYWVPQRVVSVGQSVTLAIAKGWVDAAKARGSSLNLSFKELVVSPSGEQWGWQDFQDLIDYIDDEGVAIKNGLEQCGFLDENYPDIGANSVVLGAIDLNDGVNYWIDNQGLNLGNRITTWDEVANYSGGVNAQVNVRRGGLIPVTIPMWVKGVSVADLNNKLAALWVEVDKYTNTLTLGAESYTVVSSTRPETIERDPQFQLGYHAHFTLVLTRTP